jgi:hypothetical protein
MGSGARNARLDFVLHFVKELGHPFNKARKERYDVVRVVGKAALFRPVHRQLIAEIKYLLGGFIGRPAVFDGAVITRHSYKLFILCGPSSP